MDARKFTKLKEAGSIPLGATGKILESISKEK